MTKKSISSRLENLENQHPDRPFKAIFQDWDDPTLWHTDSQQGAGSYTWDEIEAIYPDHDFIQVKYTTDWRDTP